MRGWVPSAAGIALALIAGCDLTRFTATSTAGLLERGSPAVDEHWDYELAGDALPGVILQSEGVLSLVPDDAVLTRNTARAYASYAYGWVEDDAERLLREGHAEEAREQRARALLLYERAKILAHRTMQLRSGGEFEHALARPIDEYRAWVADRFRRREDAPWLFWCGYVWGQWVNARYPHEQVRDRAYALGLVRRSIELDPSYYGASGLGVLAYVATMRPGADLDKARAAWERALEASGRENHLIQLTMARTYARRRGDRDLYVRLLREIVDAGDVDPEMRLSNRIARRRAIRYLQETDAIFDR